MSMSTQLSGETVTLGPEHSCASCLAFCEWVDSGYAPHPAPGRDESWWIALKGRAVDDGSGHTTLLCPGCVDATLNYEQLLKDEATEKHEGRYWSSEAKLLLLQCARSGGAGYEEIVEDRLWKHREWSGGSAIEQYVREDIQRLYDKVKRFSLDLVSVRNAPEVPVLGFAIENRDPSFFLTEDLSTCRECKTRWGTSEEDWHTTSGRRNVPTSKETGDFCQSHLDRILGAERCTLVDNNPLFGQFYTQGVLDTVQARQKRGRDKSEAVAELYRRQMAGRSTQEMAEAERSVMDGAPTYKEQHDAMVESLWDMALRHKACDQAQVCRIKGLKKP